MSKVEQVIKAILKELESYKLTVGKDDHGNGWEDTTYRLVKISDEEDEEE